jgi:hypothetical protein
MSRIILTTDKKKVPEGEYITVTWDCPTPDMVTLTVEDGSISVHQLGDSGSKVFQASGNADEMKFILRASIGGKIDEKTAKVKVKRKVLRAKKANRVPGSGRKNNKYKTAWSYLPADKKLAVKVMGLVTVIMILTSISPKLLPLGLIALVGYLGWVVMKR